MDPGRPVIVYKKVTLGNIVKRVSSPWIEDRSTVRPRSSTLDVPTNTFHGTGQNVRGYREHCWGIVIEGSGEVFCVDQCSQLFNSLQVSRPRNSYKDHGGPVYIKQLDPSKTGIRYKGSLYSQLWR